MKKILTIVPFAMSPENLALRQQQLQGLQFGPDLHFEYRAVKAGPVNYSSHHDFVLADASIFEAGCRAQQEGFACGPINTIDRVFRDPQVRAREMQSHMNSPSYGALDLVASPMRLSASPVSYRRAPPSLGQDTQEVLRDLQYSDDEITSLRDSGVV
jgi:hypothetical protein